MYKGFARITFLLAVLAVVVIFAFFVTQGQSDSYNRDGVLSTTSARDGDGGDSLFQRIRDGRCCRWSPWKPKDPRPPKPPRPDDPTDPTDPTDPGNPEDPTDPEEPTPPTQPVNGFNGPVRINTANYTSLGSTYTKENAPFMVSGMLIGTDVSQMTTKYNSEVEKLKQINDTSVIKWMSFSSYEVASKILLAKGPTGFATNADYLKSIGLKGISYNTEYQYSPSTEMNTLTSTDPKTNAVAKFGALAKSIGVKGYWAPLRYLADQVGKNSTAVKTIYSTGMTGIALQEQQFIEKECASKRIEAVNATYDKYKSLTTPSLELSVQIMPSRCLTGDTLINSCGESGGKATYKFQHCDIFVEGIKDKADIIAIWATASEDTNQLDELISVMRK